MCVSELVMHSTGTIGRFKHNFRKDDDEREKKESFLAFINSRKISHLFFNLFLQRKTYDRNGNCFLHMPKKDILSDLFTEIRINEYGLKSERRVLSDDSVVAKNQMFSLCLNMYLFNKYLLMLNRLAPDLDLT